MKKLFAVTMLGLAFSLLSITSHAAIIAVGGSLSSEGVAASMISAPGDVTDDAYYNTAQEGFDEKQGITLLADLAVDGGSISSGTTVNSHMIFLNSGPGNSTKLIEHFNVKWLFDGLILGVMSKSNGSLEVASSNLLGAAGTIYPASAFGARGLEGNQSNCNFNVDDCYGIFGDTLLLTMRVTEPGDWIRVITAAAVPEPSIIALFGLGLIGLGFARRKVRS